MKDNEKIIGTPAWFILEITGCVGIILINNGYEDKAYIGKGNGYNEKEDIDRIILWGKPFPLEAARLICGGTKCQ